MDYILDLLNRIMNLITDFDMTIIKLMFFSLLFIYIIFLIIYYMKKLYIKKHSPVENINTYRSEFQFDSYSNYTNPPSNLPPALVNLLINKDFINPHMLINSLMYLNKQNFYLINESYVYNKIDLEFIYTNYSKQPKERHLRYLIDWFSSYSENKDFSLTSIYKSVLSKDGAKDFSRRYNTWTQLIKKDAEELSFYYEIMDTIILSNFWLNERNKWLQYSNFIMSHFTEKDRIINIDDANNILIYAPSMLLSIKSIKKFNKDFIEFCIKNINSFNISNCNKTFSYYTLVADKVIEIFRRTYDFKSTDIYSNGLNGAFKSRASNKGIKSSTGNKAF